MVGSMRNVMEIYMKYMKRKVSN